MLERKFLFECDVCKKVFLCSGVCPPIQTEASEGRGCVCDRCVNPYKALPCNTEEVSDSRLILLAKLKKGVWINEKKNFQDKDSG